MPRCQICPTDVEHVGKLPAWNIFSLDASMLKEATCRENEILEIFAEFPKILCETTERPDIFIWSVKLKKSFRYWVNRSLLKKISSGHISVIRKKYEDLQEQCVRNDWMTCISYRGRMPRFHYQLNLRILGYSWTFSIGQEEIHKKKIQDKALTASAGIWQFHRVTTVQQSLTVFWDTAGALWAGGNDASALKPCLNQIILWWKLCWKQCCCTNISYSMISMCVWERVKPKKYEHIIDTRSALLCFSRPSYKNIESHVNKCTTNDPLIKCLFSSKKYTNILFQIECYISSHLSPISIPMKCTHVLALVCVCVCLCMSLSVFSNECLHRFVFVWI